MVPDQVLGDLVAVAKRDRAIFVKIDPDLSQSAHLVLLERGWRYSAEQIQFRNTMLVDLTRSEDELVGAMKSKTRYNVRLAQKKGVEIRPGTLSDLDLLYRLYWPKRRSAMGSSSVRSIITATRGAVSSARAWRTP